MRYTKHIQPKMATSHVIHAKSVTFQPLECMLSDLSVDTPELNMVVRVVQLHAFRRVIDHAQAVDDRLHNLDKPDCRR